MLPCGRASKLVKADLEPFIDAFVQGMVLVANLLAGQTFFECLHNLTPVENELKSILHLFANLSLCFGLKSIIRVGNRMPSF